MAFRVVHYINQFYANIGGEEKADYQPEIRDGVVGPGMALKGALGSEAEVVATVICGDSYFASNMEKASADIIEMIKKYKPDAFIAGPAFNAGRYGTACGAMCEAVSKQLGIPVVSGMYPENPGVEMYKKSAFIVQTKDNAVDMRKAVPAMAKLVLKLLKGEKLGSPAEEGYIERGVRKNKFYDKLAAERCVEMFVSNLKRAWLNGRQTNGLWYEDWSGVSNVNRDMSLLMQAAAIDALSTVALYKNEHKEAAE